MVILQVVFCNRLQKCFFHFPVMNVFVHSPPPASAGIFLFLLSEECAMHNRSAAVIRVISALAAMLFADGSFIFRTAHPASVLLVSFLAYRTGHFSTFPLSPLCCFPERSSMRLAPTSRRRLLYQSHAFSSSKPKPRSLFSLSSTA